MCWPQKGKNVSKSESVREPLSNNISYMLSWLQRKNSKRIYQTELVDFQTAASQRTEYMGCELGV